MDDSSCDIPPCLDFVSPGEPLKSVHASFSPPISQESLERRSSENSSPTPHQEFLVIDGKAQIDDMLITACFASYEQAALKRIREVATHKNPPDTHLKDETYKDFKALLEAHGLEECVSDQDSGSSDAPLNDSVSPQDIKEEDDEDEDDTHQHPCDDSQVTSSTMKAQQNSSKGHSKTKESYWSFQPVVLENLPKVISPTVELLPLGHIRSKMNDLIIVESDQEKRAVDLGSVVCRASREVLGTISDTFGPVKSPLYVVCDCTLDVVVGELVFLDANNCSFVVGNPHHLPDYLKHSSSDTDEGCSQLSCVDFGAVPNSTAPSPRQHLTPCNRTPHLPRPQRMPPHSSVSHHRYTSHQSSPSFPPWGSGLKDPYGDTPVRRQEAQTFVTRSSHPLESTSMNPPTKPPPVLSPHVAPWHPPPPLSPDGYGPSSHMCLPQTNTFHTVPLSRSSALPPNPNASTAPQRTPPQTYSQGDLAPWHFNPFPPRQ